MVRGGRGGCGGGVLVFGVVVVGCRCWLLLLGVTVACYCCVLGVGCCRWVFC